MGGPPSSSPSTRHQRTTVFLDRHKPEPIKTHIFSIRDVTFPTILQADNRHGLRIEMRLRKESIHPSIHAALKSIAAKSSKEQSKKRKNSETRSVTLNEQPPPFASGRTTILSDFGTLVGETSPPADNNGGEDSAMGEAPPAVHPQQNDQGGDGAADPSLDQTPQGGDQNPEEGSNSNQGETLKEPRTEAQLKANDISKMPNMAVMRQGMMALATLLFQSGKAFYAQNAAHDDGRRPTVYQSGKVSRRLPREVIDKQICGYYKPRDWHQDERRSPSLLEAQDGDEFSLLSATDESPHYLLRRLLTTRGCIIAVITFHWEQLEEKLGLVRLPGFASTDTIYGIGGRATISAHAKIQLERKDLTEKNLFLLQLKYRWRPREMEFERETLREIVELEKVLEDVNVEIDRLGERLAREMPEWSEARWAAIVASARERVAMTSEVTTVVKEAESLEWSAQRWAAIADDAKANSGN
ncbi:hypothetical protein CBER1_08389 [Cercospora berteroae]|uniref:Uncharacterized protein n=1 Tax=Cercospora berteroae TaxID=357750 RepID=A0A2S6CG78_9PEZI|nr:hypothetical protein CBER1_08389 [Cercospora berteroae]